MCVRVCVCKICACVRVHKGERQRESDFSAKLFAREMPSVAYLCLQYEGAAVCVAMCCNVLQCVAMCCSVLQSVAV